MDRSMLVEGLDLTADVVRVGEFTLGSGEVVGILLSEACI